MNVSAIQSCYAPSAARRWTRAADRSLDGVRVDVQSGPDVGGDSYTPSSIASPLQPPWRVIPWPRPVSAVHHRPVGVAVQSRPGVADVNAIGRTLDLFV